MWPLNHRQVTSYQTLRDSLSLPNTTIARGQSPKLLENAQKAVKWLTNCFSGVPMKIGNHDGYLLPTQIHTQGRTGKVKRLIRNGSTSILQTTLNHGLPITTTMTWNLVVVDTALLGGSAKTGTSAHSTLSFEIQ